MEPVLRLAARALVIDAARRVLLVEFAEGAETWWATPGGGLETGESHEDAIRRELVEEVGLSEVALGPCIWRREHVFPWRGRLLRQRERFFLVQVGAPAIAPALSAAQLLLEGIARQRWWTLAELESSTETFTPRRLPELVRAILQGRIPDEPVDVGT
jgi:8-oxo-dGTP pyrophosphatase MutT (NUDIX family)